MGGEPPALYRNTNLRNEKRMRGADSSHGSGADKHLLGALGVAALRHLYQATKG